MQTILEQELYEMILQWEIDLEKGLEATGSSTKKESYKFGEKTGTHYNNIMNLKRMVDSILQKGQNASDTKGNLVRVQQLQQLINDNTKLLENALKTATGSKLDFLRFDRNPGLKNFVQQVNVLLEGLTFTGRSEAMGTALEYALLAADDNIEKYIDGTTDQLLKQVTGQNLNSVATYSGINPHNVQLMNEINKKTNFDQDELKVSSIGEISEKSKYKMDVSLTYRGEEYRISAKNYKLSNFTNIHLVSSRPLLMMLLGNSDISFINNALNMLVSSGAPTSAQETAYSAMKTIAAIDGLMGSAQKEGWVDTLVINNRSQQKVKVISVSEIAQHLDDWIKISPNFLNKMAASNKKIGKRNSWIEAQKRVDEVLKNLHQIKITASLDSTKLNWE